MSTRGRPQLIPPTPTSFADVHYAFSPPSSGTPQHDRFSKSSYLYLFYNTAARSAKVEIANHAGTPDQDAVSGSLVDPAAQGDTSQWHLPAYDLRNERKYLYRLWSLSVYLWTEKDAATLLRQLTSLIPAHRLDIRDAPMAASPQSPRSSAATPAEHRDTMSPVVQQLERTALVSPVPHRSPAQQRASSVVSGNGPPTPAMSPPAASPQPQPQTFGYNPAAPSAPETVTYREKTPPPPDGGAGSGMGTQYAGMPSNYQQNNSNQVTPQAAYFAGPPSQTAGAYAAPPSHAASPAPFNAHRTFSGGLPPPPPGGPSPQPYAPSFGPPPTGPSPGQQSFGPPQGQSSFSSGGVPGQTQYATYPSQQPHQQSAPTPSFGPFATQSPGFPPSTPGYQSMQPPTPSAPPAYAGHTPLQSPALPPPPGQGGHAYSGYEYSAASTSQQAGQYHNPQGAYTGAVHGELYRPTEGEERLGRASHGHGHGGSVSSQGSGGGVAGTGVRPKMEQRVSGVEKKVGGFLKRLDRLI
ncbi:hypothetical protein LTR53_010722 [Teratosphaeriaceae sp. CCFEE 6253]|nr:hypothetical protein LTR53_010722 [Teratosphaeriaceae sp. CCFEE 6253]